MSESMHKVRQLAPPLQGERQGEGERHSGSPALNFQPSTFFETRYAGLRGNIRD
jgi:hypothetical protein